jgi:hypothetical protein
MPEPASRRHTSTAEWPMKTIVRCEDWKTSANCKADILKLQGGPLQVSINNWEVQRGRSKQRPYGAREESE